MKVQKIWPCFDSYLDAQNSIDFEREVQFVARQILQCDNQDFMKHLHSYHNRAKIYIEFVLNS